MILELRAIGRLIVPRVNWKTHEQKVPNRTGNSQPVYQTGACECWLAGQLTSTHTAREHLLDAILAQPV